VLLGAVISTVLAVREHDQRIMAEDRGDRLELATGRLEESQVDLKSALSREKTAREREQDARTRAEENERMAREAQAAAEQRRVEAEEARIAEEQQRSKAEQNEREARWHLYVARLYPMMQMWEDRDFGQLKVLIEETTPQPQDTDFRGWEWYYLQDQYRQASRVLRHQRSSYRGFGDWCPATGKIALSRSGAVDIWNQAGDRIERTLRVGNSTVTGVAFHPDGNFIACSALRKLYVVDVDTGDVKWEFAIDDARMEGDLGWSPSGDRLAFGGSDGLVRIWELESGRLLHEMTPTRGRPYLVKGLDWHPDGIHIATTAHHARCHIWNAETGDLVRTIKESGDDALTAVAWSSDGAKLALGGWNGISIRDELGNKLDSMSADLSFRASLQWSRDGSRLLFGGGQSHTVGVWDFEIEGPRIFRLHTTGVVTVAWSPDEEKALAISGISPLGEARIFDVKSPAQQEITLPISEKNLPHVCWSPSGKFITCATAEGIVLCDPINGQVARRIAGGSVTSTAWAPNGKQLAALETSSRVVIHTMSGEMGESPHGISPGRKMYDLDWSLDGKRLAVAGDGLALFDVDSWRPIAPLNNFAFAHAAKWSPDSRYLALAGHSNGRKGAGLGVFDANGRREVYYRPMGHTGRAVAWSPAGEIVAVGATAGWFRFYKADEGKLPHTAHGHKQQATGIGWSPNGRRIATSANDGQVKIWDAATGVNLISLPCDANVTCLAWSPDGRQLAGACSDGTLRIWGSRSIEVAPVDADRLESGVLASANQRRHGSYVGAATTLRAQAKRMIDDPETRLLQQLNEAINSAPAEPSNYVKRSQFYTERLRWDEAAEDLARALEHSQQKGFLRCRLAQVALAQGDKTRYRKFSQLTFEEFQQMESPTPYINATVVSLMCLVPDRIMDFQSLVTAAQTAAEEDVNAWHLRHPKLMVLYRAGNFDEAFAEVSQSHVIAGHPLQKTLVGYWKSMILAKLGRHAEAKLAFEAAEQWWTGNKPVRNQPIDAWQVGLVIETLAIRPEARALIESGSPIPTK